MARDKKTGGREKGTPNKLTQTHRELIQSIFDSELRSGKIESELEKLQGREYIEAILKLTGFVLPKLNSVDVKQTNSQDIVPLVIIPASSMNRENQ